MSIQQQIYEYVMSLFTQALFTGFFTGVLLGIVARATKFIFHDKAAG